MQKLRSVAQKLVSAYIVHKDGPGNHDGVFGYSTLQEYIRVCKNYQPRLVRECTLCKSAP